MKVIEDNKLWKIVTCKAQDKNDKDGCGSLLSITGKDFVLMYWRWRHSPCYYVAVRCPVCGKYNRVSGVPKAIVKRMLTPENKKSAIFDGFRDSE